MDAHKNYILIAEDDEDDRMLLRSAFEETSQEIKLVFVQNGIELLTHFNRVEEGLIQEWPSLLVLDLNMPKKNGKEALTELRDKKYFANFKTVIFSTTNNEAEKDGYKEFGVSDYFVKPTGYKALLDIVLNFKRLAGIIV
jgi:CheY-like chemotaxis protein